MLVLKSFSKGRDNKEIIFRAVAIEKSEIYARVKCKMESVSRHGYEISGLAVGIHGWCSVASKLT